MTSPVNYKCATIFLQYGGDAVACRFDYPDTAGNPFYFGVPVGFSENSTVLLQKVRPENVGAAVIVREPERHGLPNGFRYFDISNYIPEFVRGRLGKDQDVPGPNCYQAALASLGVEDVEGRHVDPVEAGFYFSSYFENVTGSPVLGDLRIYYKRHVTAALVSGFTADADEEPEPALTDLMEKAHDIPPSIGASRVHMFNLDEDPEWIGTVLDEVPELSDEAVEDVAATAVEPSEVEADLGELPEIATEQFQIIKPGVHAAVVLLGGTVFQRGGWDEDHVNMIVPADKAMSSIEAIIRDPFYPSATSDDDNFASHPIRKLTLEALAERERVRMIDEELSRRVIKYAGLIEHYTARLLAVSGMQWSEFANHRVDLLSMENLWNVLDDIEQVLIAKGEGLIRVLQSIDDDVARGYLKLRSLRWQYQVMVNRYDSPGRTDSAAKKKRRLRELYEKHYIKPNSKIFKEEIKMHLAMRDVNRKRWNAVIKRVVAQVKLTDPTNLLRPVSASRIDFFRILDSAIANS